MFISASGQEIEEMASAASFFGISDADMEHEHHIKPLHLPLPPPPQLHQPPMPAPPPATPQAAAGAPPQGPGPLKKRRNQPDPEAEVIALSPRTLMATNRFVCEVCNKGFQREQNLQLHRRGHNLPWKLKQKNPAAAARRRVYVCPEPTCAHHEASRALGDLTGIKKHFSRKHGEKKWKCDKCAKRYAVQSDWKAHSKICGTREYRCDCGTLFSRRDSFITHRAFCDALAQESARLPTGLANLSGQLYAGGASTMALHDQLHLSSDLLRHSGSIGLASRLDTLLNQSTTSAFRPPAPPSPFLFSAGATSQGGYTSTDDAHGHHSIFNSKPLHGLMQLPDLHGHAGAGAASTNMFNLGFLSNNSNSANTISNSSNHDGTQSASILISEAQQYGREASAALFPGNFVSGGHVNMVGGSSTSSIFGEQDMPLPQMAATALLQKAAQMGSTSASNNNDQDNTGAAALFRSFSDIGRSHSIDQSDSHIQDLMNSLAAGGNAAMLFGGHHGSGGGGGGAGMVFGNGGADTFDGSELCADMVEAQEVKFRSSGMPEPHHPPTRDFLGIGGVVQGMAPSQRERHMHIAGGKVPPAQGPPVFDPTKGRLQ